MSLSVSEVLAISVYQLICLDAMDAMAAVRAIYGDGVLSPQKIRVLQILAAHLNHERPKSLQPFLEELLRKTDGDGSKDLDEVELEAIWMSLCDKKFEFEPRTKEWKLFRSEVTVLDFFNFLNLEARHSYLHNMGALAYSLDISKRILGIRRLTPLYYPIGDLGDQALTQTYQGILLGAIVNNVDNVNHGSLNSEQLSILYVHTKVFSLINATAAKKLIEAKHLGWLSYWHLFQVSNDVLRELSEAKLDCTPEAQEVLDALVAKRLQPAN